MTVELDWGTATSAVAILGTVIGWVLLGRRHAVAEGRHLEEINNLKGRVGDLEKSEEYQRGCNETTTGALAEIRADMKWIIKAIDELRASIEGKKRDQAL